MPTISQIFWRAHALPHFHAMYGEHEIQIDIRTLEVIKRRLPKRAMAMALDWAAQHRPELIEDWNLCQSSQPLEDHRALGVIPAAPRRIKAINVLPGSRLSVTCNDGTSGIVDMSQLVASELAGVFSALKDEQIFSQVRLDLGGMTWPNNAGLDPEWIHDEVGESKTWSVLVYRPRLSDLG